MSTNQSDHVGPLKETELQDADRIVGLAFGSFLGLPNPLDFMGDRNFMTPRWRLPHVKIIAAHERSPPRRIGAAEGSAAKL
jgi:hypothetical protein